MKAIKENILQVFDKDLANTNYIRGGKFKKLPLSLFTDYIVPLANTYQRSALCGTEIGNNIDISIMYGTFKKTVIINISTTIGDKEYYHIRSFNKKDKFPAEEKLFKQFSDFYEEIKEFI